MANCKNVTAHRKSLLQIHLAVLLFGFPGLFGKWIPLTPALIVLGRVFFATVALALVLGLTRRGFRLRPPARDLGLLVFCGLVLAVHWVLFFQSVQVSSVAVGLLSYSIFPVLTAVLEPLVFRERGDRGSLFFALLCLFGVFLIIPKFDLGEAVFQGVLWGIGAGLTFSVLTLANKDLAQRKSGLVIAFYQDLFAVIFLAPALFLGPFEVTPRIIGLMAILGIFCTAAAHSLFIQGMTRVKARTASILSSLEPVYGIVLALLLLGEVPAPRTVAGGLVILAATLTVTVKAGRTP